MGSQSDRSKTTGHLDVTLAHSAVDAADRDDKHDSRAVDAVQPQKRMIILSALFAAFAMTTMSCGCIAIVYTLTPTIRSGAFVDSAHHAVGTAKLEHEGSLIGLPKLGAKFDYNTIEEVSWTDRPTGALLGFRISGFIWYNHTDMDLFLETGYTLHIHGQWISYSEGLRPPDAAAVLNRRRMWGAVAAKAASLAWRYRGKVIVQAGMAVLWGKHSEYLNEEREAAPETEQDGLDPDPDSSVHGCGCCGRTIPPCDCEAMCGSLG